MLLRLISPLFISHKHYGFLRSKIKVRKFFSPGILKAPRSMNTGCGIMNTLDENHTNNPLDKNQHCWGTGRKNVRKPQIYAIFMQTGSH